MEVCFWRQANNYNAIAALALAISFGCNSPAEAQGYGDLFEKMKQEQRQKEMQRQSDEIQREAANWPGYSGQSAQNQPTATDMAEVERFEASARENPEVQSMLQRLDPGALGDMSRIDYDDTEEMTLAYFGCQAFPGQYKECPSIMRFCNNQARALARAIRKGKSYKPWVCTDFRIIKRFLK